MMKNFQPNFGQLNFAKTMYSEVNCVKVHIHELISLENLNWKNLHKNHFEYFAYIAIEIKKKHRHTKNEEYKVNLSGSLS